MEVAHTAEPWLYTDKWVYSALSGYGIANAHMHIRTTPENAANARRIVACVNALAGLPTDIIETNDPESLAFWFLTKVKRDQRQHTGETLCR